MRLKNPDINLRGYDYGMKKMFSIIDEDVIIADFSFPMETMKEIARDCKNKLTWVDHHITAINDYKKEEPFCEAILNTDYAACEGVWKHLFPNSDIPMSVKLLSDYDAWHNSNKNYWDNMVLPFQYGMRVICNSVDTFPMDLLSSDKRVFEIIKDGLLILKYMKMTNESIANSSSFECDFKGLKAVCLNTPLFSSDSFKSVYDEAKHDIMLAYQFNGKAWKFSIYCTKEYIDGSAISKSFGGGGHKGASGFIIKNEDFSDFFRNNLTNVVK
jgi:oligoribonuclease NrnB/cAMP/cGMP phosphodiesterase (DHH superfamily)